ncbi:MAG TPA: CBS domain-containing protein [Polyangia bacterium]|jgi:CBS domain-containing protein
MLCEELMTSEVEVLEVGTSVREAAKRMRDLNLGFLPIIDDAQQLVGVLTDRDIALRVVAGDRPVDVPVDEVMTEDVISCRPDDDVERAEELMRVNQKARLVCLDEAGRVAGVISLADIAQYEDETRAGSVIADVTARETDVH